MADITSRQTEVTNAFLNDLYVLQDNLLSRAPDGAKARVSSIQYVAADDRYRVLWSQPVGAGVALDVLDVPRAILPDMANLDTIILTELMVPYQPFNSWLNIHVTEWSFALASRPRFVSSIAMAE
ncbi:MAG TPA: hypothetical protein VMY41_18145 [Thermohalobaculum sp.]|nr:hypothetical protein [Thermohalobaculum sp.]